MSTKLPVVRISDDAAALACGADRVAAAFAAAGCTVERVSSWGMHWLEPLVEIDGQGFGPARRLRWYPMPCPVPSSGTPARFM